MSSDSEDHGVILTTHQYSDLLHDTFRKYDHLYSAETPLMTLCFEMAFFVAAPNDAMIQYDAKQYVSELASILDAYHVPFIADLIYSFIRYEGLKWSHFSESKYQRNRYQRQLNFSCNDHVVDFKNARQDCVNVRTMALPMTGKMAVNVFCGYKGSEMWFGLIGCKKFKSVMMKPSVRAESSTLLYYGGRGRNRPPKDAKCHEFCNGSDCMAAGSIHGGPQRVIQHPVKAYVAGDWLTFKIDFDAKTVEFYQNGEFVYKSESSVFPQEQCFFMGAVDTRNDWFYIEQCIPDF